MCFLHGLELLRVNFQFDSEWEGLQDARLLAEMQVVRRFFYLWKLRI